MQIPYSRGRLTWLPHNSRRYETEAGKKLMYSKISATSKPEKHQTLSWFSRILYAYHFEHLKTLETSVKDTPGRCLFQLRLGMCKII